MNHDDSKRSGNPEDHFYGTATVGERGQIVVPAEARKKYGIGTGDKLLIMGTRKGLMLFKIDAMREFMNSMMHELQRAEQDVDQEKPEGRVL